MRKIVILFAVIMLMTPVLAEPSNQECFHRGLKYNTSSFMTNYNGTLMCAVDFPEQHIWWLFQLHPDTIGITSVTVSDGTTGEVRSMYLDTGNGLKKVPRPFVSHL